LGNSKASSSGLLAPDGQPQLEQPEGVVAQHGHGRRRQGDCALAHVRLRTLEAQSGLGLLERARDPDGASLEVDVAR
jgi:hypothetical protein